MRMLFIAAVATLVAAPAAAETAGATRFEHEGQTYVFTATQKADTRVITGKRYPGAVPFRLVVADGRVRGTTDGRPVTFKLSDVKKLSSLQTLASAD